MRTRRVRVGVTPVINKDRHGNDRNSPYVLGEDPRMNNGGNPVIEFDINVPVRNRDGQRVSRGYLRDLAEHLDSPNNLLYGLLREGIQAEVQYDVDEYGVELGVMRNSTETTGPNLGATTLVDFIEFDPDDEADGSSTATKVNLDEDATDELALYLIELAREAGGGFNRGRLRQEPRSEDTNVRVSEALALLSYSAVDRSFGDVNVMNNIESKDIQVPTDIAGVTTSVTWDRMSDGDRANVITHRQPYRRRAATGHTRIKGT